MLTQRQKMILAAIVEDYVHSAEPVGSRALSKHMGIPLSAATIRNEMADLEDLGLLAQPHTSAGRVPSQQGYRFYVDNLLAAPMAEADMAMLMRDVFVRRIGEFERVMQQISQILSELTQYTSIVQAPILGDGKIRHVQLVPLGGGSAVAILVTDSGHVENRHVKLDESLSSDELVEMVNLLNVRLKDVPLRRVKSHLYREIADEMATALEHYEDAIAVLDELCKFDGSAEDKLFVGGTTHMLAQPEFRDVEKVRPVLALLEQSLETNRFFQRTVSKGIQVRIGQENADPSLQNCTVISATYSIGNTPVGSIGLLGPTRMNYAKVMQILDGVANALSRVITESQHGSS